MSSIVGLHGKVKAENIIQMLKTSKLRGPDSSGIYLDEIFTDIDLDDFKYNPEDYDVVYIGGPVWAGRAANPVISYLKQNEGKFKNVKFFLTAGSSGFESGFKQMEDFSIKPLKTLALTTKEVKKDTYDLKTFLD